MSFVYLRESGDPTLVLLHGTGGDENEMLGFGKMLIGGVGYLALRGNESEHGQNRWFRRHAEGVFDEQNLIARTHELADFVASELDGAKRIAVGFSNGANIAASALLLRPEAFDAAVLLAPMVPLQPESLPMLEGKPILMVCGERDPIVPRANAQALATMFETAGAAVDLHWHAGGHSFGPTERNIVSSWLAARKRNL